MSTGAWSPYQDIKISGLIGENSSPATKPNAKHVPFISSQNHSLTRNNKTPTYFIPSAPSLTANPPEWCTVFEALPCGDIKWKMCKQAEDTAKNTFLCH